MIIDSPIAPSGANLSVAPDRLPFAGQRRTARPRLPRAWTSVATVVMLSIAAPVLAQSGTDVGGGNGNDGRSAVAQAAAGIVEGIAVDALTGAPIVAARVRITGVPREESTHDDGRFRLVGIPAGRQTITVMRIGYRMTTRTIQVVERETLTLRIEMQEAAIQLSPAVVTGTLSERTREDVLSPTSVLAEAALDRRLESTVGATLQGEAGVSVASAGPATSRPVIRGLGSDRILVLEDGLRPGDLSSTSGDHAVAIEALTARQIEIVRGPMSLLYGSSALGGVVNVIREEVPTSLPDRLHGVVSAQATSVNGGGTIGGSATDAIGPVAVRGEASYRKAGDFRTPAGAIDNTAVQTVSASGGASIVGGPGFIGGSYRFYENRYGVPEGFTGAHPGGVDIEMRRHMVRAEGERRLTKGRFTSLRGSAAFTDYYHAERRQSGTIGTAFAQKFAAADLTARHTHAGVFALGALGARVQYRDVRTGGSLRTPSTADYTVAGYIVEEMELGDFRLQVGGRYDWARFEPKDTTARITVGGERIPVRARTFGAVTGSIGALHDIGDRIRIGTSVSRAYRTPDFNELYSNGPHLAAGSYDVGDPGLEEETGFGIDAFARFTDGRLRAEVAVFRNMLSGYIFPASRGRVELGTSQGVPRLQYTNEDALFTGAEAELEWSLTRRVVLDGTVSYVAARFTSERDSIPDFFSTPGDTVLVAPSRYPPFIPPLNGRVGLRYETPRYFGGATLRLASPQRRVGDFPDQPTAGFAVGSISAGVRMLAGGRFHTLTLRVENVADQEFRDHLSRTKETMPEPGRDVSLLYRMTF